MHRHCTPRALRSWQTACGGSSPPSAAVTFEIGMDVQGSAHAAASYIYIDLWMHELQVPSSTADTIVAHWHFISPTESLYLGTGRELEEESAESWHCTHCGCGHKALQAPGLKRKQMHFFFFSAKWGEEKLAKANNKQIQRLTPNKVHKQKINYIRAFTVQ